MQHPDRHGINYVAIRSKEDFFDQTMDESSRLVGAHLNHEFDFTGHGEIDLLNLVEHSRVVTEQSVFEAYDDYLNGGSVDKSQSCHTATNDQHVASERAEKKTRFIIFSAYKAVGSGDDLGTKGNDTTSLKETKKRYWEEVSSCPE